MKFAATLSLAMGLAPLVLGKVALVQSPPSRRDLSRAQLERRKGDSSSNSNNDKNGKNDNSSSNNNNNNNNNKGSAALVGGGAAAALAAGELIGANSVLATEAQLAELQAIGLARSGVGAEVIWINLGGGAQTTVLTQTVTATVTQNGGGATNAAAADSSVVTAAASVAGEAPPAAAATHTVLVGGPAGKVFTPSSLSAAVGDTVEFRFRSVNHTVTQSAFDTPCVKMEGGMDTGFMANPNDTSPEPAVAMEVKVSTPLWFYCKAKGHCGAGMTLSVNPTAAKTEAMFQSMAIAQNGTGTATGITGGTSNTTASGGEAAASSSASAGEAKGSGSGSGSGTGVVTGTGTVGAGGECMCAVMCPLAGNSVPNPSVQGNAAFGGMFGSLPVANMMV